MNATSQFAVERPLAHDVESIRPHMRRHLKPFKFLIAGSEVTIHGTNYAEAKKRFKAQTSGSVAFIPGGRG